jgi:hypothetical protein
VASGDWEPARGQALETESSARFEGMLKLAKHEPAAFLTEFEWFEETFPLSVAAIPGAKIRALYALGRPAQAAETSRALMMRCSQSRDAAAMLDIAEALVFAQLPVGKEKDRDITIARHAASLADGLFEGKSAPAKAAYAEAWFLADSTVFALREARAGLVVATGPKEKTRLHDLIRKYEAAQKNRK